MKKLSESEDITTLVMNIEIYDEEIGDYRTFKPFIKKSRGNNVMTLHIDIKTGIIRDWVEKTGGIETCFFYKAVDTGKYTLLDKEEKVIASFTGYVPNKLVPDRDGFGDYITLNINPEGKILNWYKKPSFKEFPVKKSKS
jgi:hypothetical protein